ncbi:hypothetical protein L6164_006473 [Bauhinia variegata]|uniref:Uncharacterized protein n=1 Tax=Bauhinia variegata TaxID=167791 RepID=A0ACB9PTS6_BAUVA|nr:hypothetical protein L6164_006473 [Bauhinia variegata]
MSHKHYRSIRFCTSLQPSSFRTNMYKQLPRWNTQVSDSDDDVSESTEKTSTVPSEFLCQAVFAGDSFRAIEAAYGRVDGVVRTATGYCGGTLKKPTYREVCEGRTGHTEAVKVIYDKRKISYKSLCDLFWETHDPTRKEYLNFGIDTHLRSAIFYCSEAERKEAQESKIRRQMKINKRIVTKLIPLFDNEFFMAENQHQKYYLQQKCRLCECLCLRSTEQFVESEITCKLNSILALEGGLIVDELSALLKAYNMSKQIKVALQELTEELSENAKGNTQML